MNREFVKLKRIQYMLFAVSIILLLPEMICVWRTCPDISMGIFHRALKPFLLIISDALWERGAMSFLLSLQALCLLVFFGIGAYIEIKILPDQLSELQKRTILQSPHDAFDDFFFSKILFVGRKTVSKEICDLRNEQFTSIADLYLFHFRISNKGYVMAFIASIVIGFPLLVGVPSRGLYSQVIMNLAYLNLSLLLFMEIILLGMSKKYTRRSHGV